MSNELRKALDLDPEEDKTKREIAIEQVEDDFDFARKNLYEIIGKGTEALEDMIDLARKSQNPRAYEVLRQLIDSTAALNQDLITLQKKKQDIAVAESGETKVVNQNLFVGTTADLNKILEDRKNSGTQSE